jgi:hypothetical protein
MAGIKIAKPGNHITQQELRLSSRESKPRSGEATVRCNSHRLSYTIDSPSAADFCHAARTSSKGSGRSRLIEYHGKTCHVFVLVHMGIFLYACLIKVSLSCAKDD